MSLTGALIATLLALNAMSAIWSIANKEQVRAHRVIDLISAVVYGGAAMMLWNLGC